MTRDAIRTHEGIEGWLSKANEIAKQWEQHMNAMPERYKVSECDPENSILDRIEALCPVAEDCERGLPPKS